MRFWLIPPCECVWVYDCPKDKSWQPSKECKNHNCTSSLQITILCRHNIWAAQAFPCKKACIFQRWSHLYSSLFSLLLYLSQWLMSRCGWFKCSVAPHDVMVSPAMTARCWQRAVWQNRIFSLVQELLSVVKFLVNTSNKNEFKAQSTFFNPFWPITCCTNYHLMILMMFLSGTEEIYIFLLLFLCWFLIQNSEGWIKT